MMPDKRGYFGEFGGRFVTEVLVPALEELAGAYGRFREDRASGKAGLFAAALGGPHPPMRPGASASSREAPAST